MLKKNLILLFAFLLQVTGFGQQSESSDYSRDTAHVNRCIAKSSALLYIHPDSSLLYNDTILSLSAKINYPQGLFKGNNLNGILAWMNADFDNAFKYYRTALIYADQMETKRSKALVLGNMGLAFRHAYMLDSAIIYLNKTIEYSHTNKVPDIEAKAYLDLANYYLAADNYTLTVRNLVKAENIYDSIKDDKMLLFTHITYGILFLKVHHFDEGLFHLRKAVIYDNAREDVNHLSTIYTNMGELYYETEQNYDSALYYYRKSVGVALPFQKDNAIMTSHVNIGNVFIVNKNYDSAGYYYNQAYQNADIHNYPDRKAAVLVNLGIYHIYTKDTAKARTFLKSGLKLSEELGILRYKKNALMFLSKLDSISGNFEQSLAYFKEFKNASDSLNASDISHQIAVLDFEKELAAQKTDNQLLEEQNRLKSKQISQQRKLIWISLTALAILLIMLYFLYVNRRKRKKLHLQLEEKHRDLLKINEELKVTNETLKEQQEQLKEMNVTKDKFFSILGHDLKSPFNTLLGMLSLLDQQWDILNDSEKREHMKSLYASSEKTYHLLEELLSWGKAQQGLIKFQPETFNVRDRISYIIDFFRAQIEQKSLLVDLQIFSDLRIHTDPRLFSQIIQNLVNNAIKYSYPGDTITIFAKQHSDKFCLCVKDTGMGIPKEKLANIFRLDSDFNRPGTNNEKSTGMGLILIKEYADIIGGRLTAESENEQGSTFCLCLGKNKF